MAKDRKVDLMVNGLPYVQDDQHVWTTVTTTEEWSVRKNGVEVAHYTGHHVCQLADEHEADELVLIRVDTLRPRALGPQFGERELPIPMIPKPVASRGRPPRE